jgi:hypothetical protein
MISNTLKSTNIMQNKIEKTFLNKNNNPLSHESILSGIDSLLMME